jgi:uncharacterized damage-inducible protein DinB
MTGKDAIKTALTSTQNLLSWYVSDLSDEDLRQRPVPGANTIAWQIGHLTVSEPFLLRMELPSAAYPELPAAFAQRHATEKADDDSAAGLATKGEYLERFNQARNATLANLEKLSDADLDRTSTGRMARVAPTLGSLLLLISNHTLMHAGQFTVLRRKLGKPVLF